MESIIDFFKYATNCLLQNQTTYTTFASQTDLSNEDIFQKYMNFPIIYQFADNFSTDPPHIFKNAKLIETYNQTVKYIYDSNTLERFQKQAQNELPIIIRQNFSLYASIHSITLLDALKKWNNKFILIFPNNSIIDDLIKEVELEEWTWD